MLANNDENYLNAISPLLYYLIEHKSIVDYLFATYKQLKDKFILLNKKLTHFYDKKCQEQQITDEEIVDLINDHAFTNDKLLFGFIPLMPYFTKQKTSHKRFIPAEKQHIAKIRDTTLMLNALGCNIIEANEDAKQKVK